MKPLGKKPFQRTSGLNSNLAFSREGILLSSFETILANHNKLLINCLCYLWSAAGEIPLTIPKVCHLNHLLPLYWPNNRPIHLDTKHTQHVFLEARNYAYATVSDVQLSLVFKFAKSNMAITINF